MDKRYEDFIDRFVKCKSDQERIIVSAVFVSVWVIFTFIRHTLYAGVAILVVNALFDTTFQIVWAVAYGGAIGAFALVVNLIIVRKLFREVEEMGGALDMLQALKETLEERKAEHNE